MTARIPIALLAAALLAAGCEKHDDTAAGNASVLGNAGTAPSRPEPEVSAREKAARDLPPAPAPSGTPVQVTMADAKTGLALWEQDGLVMVSRYTNNTKWQPPLPLERIYGEASHARLASNGRGVAFAIWQHTVGQIESLRYSRYESGKGWSTPDVMPGALPRPHTGSDQATAPRIEVDAQGNAIAQWRSGFDEGEVQASTYVPGEGWASPVDLPLHASQPAASEPSQS
jgi:hypothetical protein